jgi:hypothetical protein
MSDFDNPGQPCPSELDAEVHGPLFEQVRFYCSFEDREAAPALFLSDSCRHAGACRFVDVYNPDWTTQKEVRKSVIRFQDKYALSRCPRYIK